ncbi:hydroxylamine reductase [bacterium]|nr:hydroxylamine reductase [candidate division CSSED10-310 bacterium]
MFCYQCQETAKNQGCTVRGVCGKLDPTSARMDVLIYMLRGIAIFGEGAVAKNVAVRDEGFFITRALFATITNANFDDARIESLIKEAVDVRKVLSLKAGFDGSVGLHDSATWTPENLDTIIEKAHDVGVLATENEDVRSLRELLIYGLKGLSAYSEHAAVLGYFDDSIFEFIMKALASTTRDLPVETMVSLVMQCGSVGVKAMALLDKANTETYGHPVMSQVNLGVRKNPGILISGHDLKDMEELLLQTSGTGVDVYTHSEMLPANYYPAFKKYDHFVGNYGSSWWSQNSEFETFNGPILMTTNCIIPVRESYRNRVFTTGMAGYPGCRHIGDRLPGKQKDFSEIIRMAQNCQAPQELETGSLTGGFAHNQVIALADKVVDAVKSGKIRRFIVMAGCDGRHKTRNYYTEVAEALPGDTVILTAGCAKYRYNKLNLGDIEGIPRVLDAGQCNDSYSLAVIALKLKEVFNLEDINDLPISYDIAWYEQKAVIVLLALLSLGIKGIRLGPTLPGFLSPAIVKVLVDNFGIKPIGTASDDIADMLAGN